MTIDEYKSWLDYHCSLFPAYRVWLNEDLQVRGNSVFKSLAAFQVTTAELQSATDDLIATSPDVYPRVHLSELLARIRQARADAKLADKLDAAGRGGKPYSYHDAHRCPQCRDTGRVTAYHPKAYRPLREKTYQRGKHLGECVVACAACELGEREREKNSNRQGQFKGLPTFDDARMCVVTARVPADQERELFEFLGITSS